VRIKVTPGPGGLFKYANREAMVMKPLVASGASTFTLDSLLFSLILERWLPPWTAHEIQQLEAARAGT
jgi:hypothetical protein